MTKPRQAAGLETDLIRSDKVNRTFESICFCSSYIYQKSLKKNLTQSPSFARFVFVCSFLLGDAKDLTFDFVAVRYEYRFLKK